MQKCFITELKIIINYFNTDKVYPLKLHFIPA